MGRWHGCALALALAFSVASAASRTASAGGGAATDAYEGIREKAPLDVHALVDLYSQHDFGWPPSGTVQLRAFDVRSDVPSLNFARLTVARRPEVLGFRLDAGVGDTADGYLRADPAASTYPRLSRVLSYVEQAFVTARLPVAAGHDVAIDAGKFGTPVGLEDNETQQNWSYSRSLLDTWAEPTTHTGVRATVAATGTLAFSAFWLNGWNANVVEGDGMRSFAVAASWRPGVPALELSATYTAGLERDPRRLGDPALAFRHELDGFAIFSPTRHVTLAFTADHGRDAAAGGVSWWGVGGYVRCSPRSPAGRHAAGRALRRPGRLHDRHAAAGGRAHGHDRAARHRVGRHRDRTSRVPPRPVGRPRLRGDATSAGDPPGHAGLRPDRGVLSRRAAARLDDGHPGALRKGVSDLSRR
jgi:hypothetical protein